MRRFTVGGRKPRASDSTEATASMAPAAPSVWPTIDLMLDTGTVGARAPRTLLIASVSAASLCGVPVPCALT